MTLLLDSSVLIDVLRGRNGRRALMAELVQRGDSLATASINVGEIYSGLKASEESLTETVLSPLDIYPLTAKIARTAGSLKYFWARKGITLGLADMIVAATALEHDLILMTDNRREFPIPELHLFDL